MSPSVPPLTDDDLVASAKAGELFDLLEGEIDHDPVDSLLNRAAALHNDGRIDLVRDTLAGSVETLVGRNFFSAQTIFCELIPKLNAPVPEMISLVKQLVEKGGNDGAAHFPLQAFKAWLANDLARAEEILAIFRAGSTDDAAYLSAALEVLADPVLVYPFLTPSDTRRQFAASALGTIRPADDVAADHALSALLPLARSDAHDMTRFTATYVSFDILQHVPHLAAAWAPRFIEAVRANSSARTIEALLHGVWRRSKLLAAQDVANILDLAMADDLTDERLLNLLIIVLGQLVATVHRARALDDLTILLERGLVPLNKNSSILHYLHAMDHQQTFDLVVRWLGTGNANLCEAAVAITTKAGQAPAFVGDLSGAGLASEQIIALSQRAVAYFFIHPVTAASLILAGLRAKDAKATPVLTHLLYFPLLLNYLGSVQDYLKTIKRGDPAWGPARKALKLAEAYVKGLEIKSPIKELHPSETQLNIARERRMAMNREMHKQVRKESVLLSLVHESTVLYGRSTMTYAHGADQPPITMDMHAFSHSMEVPRLDILDPVGLSWMLFRFKRL